MYDASNNEASCSFDVTVEDQEPPHFPGCPPPQDHIVDGATVKGVTWEVPVAFDNVDDSVEVVPDTALLPLGNEFPFGENKVRFTSVDSRGNEGVCELLIRVHDDVPPSITCPPDVHGATDPGNSTGTVMWETPVADDNVGVVEIIVDIGGGASPEESGELSLIHI